MLFNINIDDEYQNGIDTSNISIELPPCITYTIQVSAYFQYNNSKRTENISSESSSKIGEPHLPAELSPITLNANSTENTVSVTFNWTEEFNSCILEREITYFYSPCLNGAVKNFTNVVQENSTIEFRNDIPGYREVNISMVFNLKDGKSTKGETKVLTKSIGENET